MRRLLVVLSCLLLAGCTAPTRPTDTMTTTTEPRQAPSPVPTSAPPLPRAANATTAPGPRAVAGVLEWNTTRSLQNTTLAFHVEVAQPSTCQAIFYAAFADSGSPGVAYMGAAGADGNYGLLWGGAGAAFGLHAGPLRTDNLTAQAHGGGHGMIVVGLRNQTVSHSLDFYAAGSPAPWRDAPPPLFGLPAWPQDSLHLRVSCNHAIHVAAGRGEYPILADYLSAPGGIGAYATTPAAGPGVEVADQVKLAATAANVTVFGAGINSATVMQVQAPHANPTWTFTSQTEAQDHLTDTAGTYIVTITHAPTSAWSANLLALLPVDPRPLDAILND